MKVTIKQTVKEDISPEQIVDSFLKERGIENEKEFLNPIHPEQIRLGDFFDDKKKFDADFKKVLELLKIIKEKGESIVVYTDYDADGITGGAILWETLYLLGFKAMPYVPHRKLEGYGFSQKGIDAVKEKYNPALIISVDHGIAAAEKISYAKSLGIPIVVTDHHMKSAKSPDDALAVFHTSQLSGSGVSYFFSKEVFEHFKTGSKHAKKLEQNFKGDYLNFASVGTIADLVPLQNASRSIVKYGLENFRKCIRPGIVQILKEAGISEKDITPYEIGFVIAPRINAVGRLEHAIDALRLLCTPNEVTAKELAKKVGITNKDRQDLVKKAVLEARELVLKNKRNENNIIIVNSTEISDEDSYWNEGIIGLISSKLTEEYYRPSIVLTKNDGFLKASSRSIPGFDITTFLRSLQEYLVDVGGHTQAAGFTIAAEKLKGFTKEAEKRARLLISKKDLERSTEVDIAIPLSMMTMKLIKLFDKFKPYGMGNKEPVFMSTVTIVEKKSLGKLGDHLKLMVKEKDKKMPAFEMLAFSQGKNSELFVVGNEIQVIYKAEINTWNNKESVVGKLVSIV